MGVGGVVSGSIANFNHNNGIEADSGEAVISGNNTSFNGGAGISHFFRLEPGHR